MQTDALSPTTVEIVRDVPVAVCSRLFHVLLQVVALALSCTWTAFLAAMHMGGESVYSSTALRGLTVAPTKTRVFVSVFTAVIEEQLAEIHQILQTNTQQGVSSGSSNQKSCVRNRDSRRYLRYGTDYYSCVCKTDVRHAAKKNIASELKSKCANLNPLKGA